MSNGSSSSSARDFSLGVLIERVRQVATRLKRRLPPHVDLDDLIAAGNLGLAQALAHGQVGEPGAFEAYALKRATGAMLDELRGNDQLTRGQRRLARRLEQVEKLLAQELGTQPETEQVAEALGMSAGDLAEARARTVRRDRVSISVVESHTLSHPSIRPDAMLDAVRRAEKLRGAVTLLPSRLKVVVDLSCGEELTLREIGKRLGVTEARVCQLRQEAVRRLRTSCNEASSAASAA